MREKGKTHEWESTPGNRSAQELLHEFRNFLSSYTWVNLFLFLFLCWKFLLQHHSGVGYFQEGCSPSVTCVPHLRGRRKRAPSAGKKIKTHVQDKKKKPSLCCKLDWDTKLFTQTTGQLPNSNLSLLLCQPWRSSAWEPRERNFVWPTGMRQGCFKKNKSCQPRQVANEQLSY